MRALRLVLWLAALTTACATLPEDARELHAVGVYEGFPVRSYEGTGISVREGYNGNVLDAPGLHARVLVDRPDKDVVLLLSSVRDTQWDVEVTPGTRLERVVLPRARAASRVSLNGTLLESFERSDLSFGYREEGASFRFL